MDHHHYNHKRQFYKIFFGFISILQIVYGFGSDITPQVFGTVKDGVVAAFGDFNSDELTDVMILRNNSHTLEILLGADTEPLLREGHKCEYPHHKITSVVPGDFNGDAYMDILVTVKSNDKQDYLKVYVNWGGSDYLNCTTNFNDTVIDNIYGEPIAIDFNQDMVIDLFGMGGDKQRTFWVFDKNGKAHEVHQSEPGKQKQRHVEQENQSQDHRDLYPLKVPHSHAYLDLNHDFAADLFLQTKKNYEIWYGITSASDEKQDFAYSHKIEFPVGMQGAHIGQSVFIDMELKGVQTQILPLCYNEDCSNSAILSVDGIASKHPQWNDLKVNFKDPQGQLWGFIVPSNNNRDDDGQYYTRTITARAGDYNMDGYPDLLLTLQHVNDAKKFQTFLLENVPCTQCDHHSVKRTFEVKWYALAPMGNNTIAGTFYDFFQDGILDVLLVEKKSGTNKYRPLAFRNTLDYDANFVKVIVLTGLTNVYNETKLTPLGRKKRVYGTNLPGPRIIYHTTTQEGDEQHGSSVQLPQSAYFSLQLPYTIFGLGRTPNFVDSLTVGLYNRSRTWTQIIPNSQMIVIPRPQNDPQYWKAQLFVTPSKLILMSVMALSGTCLFIILVILAFYIKEKREDKQEKLQEAHRFHFDAM